MNQEIDRVDTLTRESFQRDYLEANKPVVVTGAMRDWRIEERWSREYLEREFGDERVQVYNSYFDLTGMSKLRAYFRDYFDREQTPSQAEMPYVRWYTKLRDVKFLWADDVFLRFRDNWSTPAFLPETDYVLPYVQSPKPADATLLHFPAKGLFISGKGARTGLHLDPWGSDALLCQLAGVKEWVMYAPDQAEFLRDGNDVVDLDRPDRERFPNFDKAVPTYTFTQRPGDMVFVPHDWLHSVNTVEDSISLTWNFVHSSTKAALLAWLDQPLSSNDESVLRFFYGEALGSDATPARVRELLSREPALAG